jgi:hypothetical protein
MKVSTLLCAVAPQLYYVQAKMAEHVILFGVDGLRADTLQNANTPKYGTSAGCISLTA